MKKFKKQSLAFILLLVFFSFKIMLISSLSTALAQPGILEGQEGFSQVGEIAYGQTGHPLDVRLMVVRIINVSLGLLATIFLVLVVIAGFQWMMAGGNQEKTKGAASRIKNALIGLIIITASWGISYFVLMRLRAITGGYVHYYDPPMW